MVYHTFVSGEVLTAANVMNDLMNQSVIVCTSGTRPASPVAGMVVYETDTTNFSMYTGTGWITMLPQSTTGRGLMVDGGRQVTTTGSVTSTETVYPGITDVQFAAVNGRRYKVIVKAAAKSSTADSTALLNVRWSSSGAPTNASTIVSQNQLPMPFANSVAGTSWATTWTPGTTATVHVALFGVRNGGTGTLTLGDTTLESVLIVQDVGT